MHDPAKLPVLENQIVTPDTPKYALANNSELTHYVDLVDFPKPWDDETIATEKARHLMHAYYACVSYVDAQIGRLLAALEEEGLAENTIVVLWSDHGWKLGEYRGWGKMTNYEIDARVPLVISAPGITGGKQTDQLVELLDLFPTLCDLTGLDTPEFVDGVSIVPTLNDIQHKIRDSAVSQYYRRLDGRQYMGYSLRTDSHRFTEWRDFETGEVTDLELYDHRSNHSETENIADSASKDLVEELTELLLKDHPRKALVMKPAIHSAQGNDRAEAKISFQNQSESVIMVYVINSGGRRGKAKQIVPGKKLGFKTRVGNVFVVESVDGKVHEIHPASAAVNTVVLK